MALEAKKYDRIFSTADGDADKIDTEKFNSIKDRFDNNEYLDDEESFETLGPVLYQMQQFADEFDSVRSHVANDIVGQQGPTGATGATGARGATGATGAAGSDGAAGTDGKDAGVYIQKKVQMVFIPASSFVGLDYGAYSQPGGTMISNAKGTLHAMWPGIEGKTVDKVYVHTDSSKAISKCVSISKSALGTVTSLCLPSNSDTLIDITDWACTLEECLSITVTPNSNTIKIHGATLTLK